MSRLYSSEHIQKVLEQFGFFLVCQKDSHGKLKNSSGRVVILPMNKNEIPLGTFRSILRQAGINEVTFKNT